MLTNTQNGYHILLNIRCFFTQTKGLKKGGASNIQVVKIFGAWNSQTGGQQSPMSQCCYKRLGIYVSGKYIDQNTVCSHIIHNQAMYQHNWSNSSYNNHLYTVCHFTRLTNE